MLTANFLLFVSRSGLYAANTVKKAGKSVLVVEAADYVGGRTRQVRNEGRKREMTMRDDSGTFFLRPRGPTSSLSYAFLDHRLTSAALFCCFIVARRLC